MTKTAKRITIIAIVLVIALLVAWPRLDFLKADDKKAAQNPGSQQVGAGGGNIAVDVLVVKTKPLANKIQSTGTILANEEVEIRSEISGKVTGIYFDEGDKVRKGKILVRINDEEQQAQLKRLEYNIKLTQQQESRQKQLLTKEAISQQEYDIALTNLNSIQSEMQQLRAVVDKYTIRAPFNGEIGLRYVSEGSYISPVTPIATMQDIDQVKIEFTVSEQFADMVKQGNTITFFVNGRDKKYTGTVYAVEPRIDLATRSLRVRAKSTNPDRELIPGAFARIELTLETIDKAVLIPTEALIPELNGQKVYLMKGGRAIPAKVETGIRTDREIQITKGLEPSDSLIVTGLLQIKDSVQVQVKEMQQSAKAAKEPSAARQVKP